MSQSQHFSMPRGTRDRAGLVAGRGIVGAGVGVAAGTATGAATGSSKGAGTVSPSGPRVAPGSHRRSASSSASASAATSSQPPASTAPASASAEQREELHMPASASASTSASASVSVSASASASTSASTSGSGSGSGPGPSLGPHPASAYIPPTQINLDHRFSPRSSASVPQVLQPGGLSARPPPPSSSSSFKTAPAPSAAHLQPSHYSHELHEPQEPIAAPSNLTLDMSHAYSRSSPAAAYDGSPSAAYHAYTPTTPSGASSHFMPPSEPAKYIAPASQRHLSSTPLGLADIRPRADSSISDGPPGALGYDLTSLHPGPSNYVAPWALYAFDWCKWPPQGNGAGKLAIGSYLEDGHNFIQILDSHVVPTPQDVYVPGTSKYSLDFKKVAEATHSYPITRLLWEPPSSQKQSTDLLATSGDHLRLWSLPSETPMTPGNSITRQGREVPNTKLTPLALLSNSKTPDHTAPLTSLDWNTVTPSLIITSSIDTTCTIWDIPSLTAKTQLIAHDKEVYDVRFCANSVDVFVSCGQDGSVRMFDLRSLEHSTIIYEPTGKEERGDNASGRSSPGLSQQATPPPLLRLATSPHDTHLLATFAQDSSTIRVLDVRQPGQALLELRGHTGPVNCLEWSPLRRGTLASGGDDCQVLLWDLLNASVALSGPSINGSAQQDNQRSPVACWECEYEVGNLGWVPRLQSADYGEWLGVGAGRDVWGARVM